MDKPVTNNSFISLDNLMIIPLEYKNIDDYLKIGLDAFYSLQSAIYSDNFDAAYNITKKELIGNIGLQRYFCALYKEKVVGTMELVTRESIKYHRTSFFSYLKYLGFLKAVPAYLLNKLKKPRLDNSSVYIDGVAVYKGSRHAGVGSSMMSFAEKFARDSGKVRLRLWVAKENTIAIGLYKKHGFKQLAIRTLGFIKRYFGYSKWIYMGKELYL